MTEGSTRSLLASEAGSQTLPLPGHALPSPQLPYMYFGLPPGSVMRGSRIDGRMSPIRRFFCLFVTFDLLLTCLLWLISLMIEGEFNINLVIQSIVNYNIRYSLFDIATVSAIRFLVLLFFYGFLQFNHWFVVASTTALTGLFLVAKVYLFMWGDTSSQVLKVVLVLSSFILSWAEAWLLDIKVVPHEKFAQNYIDASSMIDEQTPLMRQFLQSHHHADVMSESMGSFYSPVDSSNDSSDDTSRRSVRRSRRPKISLAANNYIAKGEEFLKTSWDTLNDDKWVFEKETTVGDVIHCRKHNDGHKIFRLTGFLDIKVQELVKILYNKLEDFPKWNPTIKSSKIIQTIDSKTDICYQISKEVGKGLVSSREYVLLRHLGQINDSTIIASASIIWPRLASSRNVIRGEVGPSCWAIRQISEASCEVKWLLNTKINGWIPTYAIESALSNVMAENMAYLRQKCQEED